MGAVHKPTNPPCFPSAGMALRWPGSWVPRCTAVRPCWRQWKAPWQRSWSWCLYWKKATWTWPNGTLPGFLDGFYGFLFFVFFSRILLIFVVGCLPHIPKKQRERKKRWYARHITKYIVRDEGKKKWEDAGWVVGKDWVGDRYILKAKIVPLKKLGDLRIPDDAKVNNQKKKTTNIHTYSWFKKSCTTWDVNKTPVNNGRNPDIANIPLFTWVLLTSQLLGLGISSTNRKDSWFQSMCGHPAWWWSIY